MAEPITVQCSADLSNLFTRSQHFLDRDFGKINGLESTWSGLIPNGGRFPVGSGFAARVTTLGQQRLTFSSLNQWRDMSGLQSDCAVSCDPPSQVLEFANADHKWYRLAFQAYNTKPYCLESMFADALNLPSQIQQIYMNLKMVQSDTRDEFSRNNHAAISANRWNGHVSSAGVQSLQKSKWRFATDANGNIDTTYVILDATLDPDDISVLSVGGVLNRIRNRGTYIGTFPKDGNIRLVTDYETFQELPLYDTNVRADNRFRAPTVLNPAYAATTEYGGYVLHNDPFSLRYYWTETEADYPDGVLKRIDQWSNQLFSEGCWSDLSSNYEDADFQISFPFGRASFEEKNGMQPTSAGSGADFAATAAPWSGAWRWLNEVNEITPCNVDRNKGFWRAVYKMAAKPMESGIHGHAVLHRRFPFRGITKVCRPLGAPVLGSEDCTLVCPPLDNYPPALIDPFVCGRWNDDSCSSVGN